MTGGESSNGPARTRHSFRNLASWQKAQAMADEVLDVVDTLPNTRVTGVLAQQIVKSATSVAANIAEGHGRFAVGAYRNHLSIARGSANETIGWIELLSRRGYVTPARRDELFERMEEILRIISAQMIQLDKQSGTSRSLREEQAEYVFE